MSDSNDVYISGEWLKLKHIFELNDGNTYEVIRTILPGMHLIRKVEDDEYFY